MSRYVEGSDRSQVTLLPECLDDYIAEDNTVRVVEAFVEELDLAALGFTKAAPAATGRPATTAPRLAHRTVSDGQACGWLQGQTRPVSTADS